MLIGIDGNEANVKNRVGSNVYAFQLLWNIFNIQRKSEKKIRFKIYLKKAPLGDLPKKGDWWQYKILKPSALFTQLRLPLQLYLEKKKPDVFFTPGHYAPRFSPIPTVISIMDLAFLRFPGQFRRKDLYQLINWTKYSVNNASHIFTISEFSKKEIIYFYNYPKEKITVTYPGTNNSELQNPKSKTKIKNLKLKIKNYFLYIGTLQPRKNLITLIEAFKKINSSQNSELSKLKLVIVGKKGWMYEEIFSKVKQLGLEDKVIFTGFVSEEEKTALLKNAIAYVLPSLYEGFGIPVIEAMQAGCPVVISRNSSLPEVGGEAAEYIQNPQEADSIQKSMQKMVKLAPEERNKLIKKGYSQAQKFSWEKCAEKTLEILLKLTASK